MRKSRNSTIELLRIISMILILMTHANFKALGVPHGLTTINFMRGALESLSYGGVIIFILITGYYGTRFKIKKVLYLIFQCACAIVASSILVSYYYPSATTHYQGWFYWFIAAYLGMLIMTPMLNSIVQTWDKIALQRFLALCVISLPLLDVFMPAVGLRHGCSSLWFCIIYLVGRYISQYPITIPNKWIIAIIIVCTSINGVVYCYVPQLNIVSNIFMAATSLCIFELFNRLPNTENKFINYISPAMLMVYLTNDSQIGQLYYLGSIRRYARTYDSPGMLLLNIAILIFVWFVASVIFGKICNSIWAYLVKMFKVDSTN